MAGVLAFVIGALCTAIAKALGHPWWHGTLVALLIIAVVALIEVDS